MKIPVCAGLHYARPFPPNHSVLRDTTPNVEKRVKMTPSTSLVSAILCVLFFSLLRRSSSRSSFDVCISIMCVCMCVCGCVQEDWCVFRDEETGGWFR